MKQAAWGVVLLLTGAHLFGGTYGSGNGGIERPYCLSEPQHLTELSQTPDDWGVGFILTADIDMAGAEFTSLGSSNFYCNIKLDGQGFAIRNLPCAFLGHASGADVKNLTLIDVNSQDHAGLINYSFSSRVENCHVIANVTCDGTDAGGLIGYAYLSEIVNCSSAGTITGGQQTQRLGGLIGHVELGSVTACSTSASVNGGTNSLDIGGLIGRLTNCTISDCWSAATVSAPKSVGGLIGTISCNLPHMLTVSNCFSAASVRITEGQTGSGSGGGLVGTAEGNGITVTRCRSTGPVSSSVYCSNMGGLVGTLYFGDIIECSSSASVAAPADSSNIGGLIGRHTAATVERCCSSGTVSSGPGNWYVGGLTGMQMEASSVTRNCYSTSPVSGFYAVGGLIGYAGNDQFAQIEKCFAAGPVTGTYDRIGGLLGASYVTVSGSFYDTQTTGMTASAAGKAKITADMQNPATFTSAGWDLEGETANGGNDDWRMNGYPMLAWEPRIGADELVSVSLPRGQQGQLAFDVYSITGDKMQWTLEGLEAYPWMTGVSSNAGATGDRVTVNVSAASLACADYAGRLKVIADNGDIADVIVKVAVYEPVSLAQLAALSLHWTQNPCDWGQPCKAADWFVDGSIDDKDLLLLADNWLGSRIEPAHPTIADTFESGGFSTLNWQHAGDGAWKVEPGGYEGTYGARSHDIGDGQSSELVLTYDLTGHDVDAISFAARVSSENGYDYLRFTIDGVEVRNWSGTQNWAVYTFAVTPGPHTFKWTYTKDGDGSAGEDSGWIDNVRIYKMQ